MRKLILKMAVSLDGFVGRPDGDLSWIFPYYDDEFTAYEVELLRSAGEHAMGRQAYEDMAPYWQASSEPFAAPMNEIPKVVFSSTLREATWPETRIAGGELGAEVARLKAEDGGPLLAHGGARFAQALTRLGLVDEYRLNVRPVALGAGLPLFGGAVDLELVAAQSFPRGTVAVTYTARQEAP